MTSIQKSIWSSDEPSNLHHRQSLTNYSKTNINKNNQLTINVWSDETSEDEEEDSKTICSPYWLCIRCCILGSLLAGIILAVILTLWLSNTTTPSQAPSIITSSISETLTTTETTTTTTVTIPMTAPAPPCGLSASFSANILLTTTSAPNTIYNCYAFGWVSPVTGTVSLNFQFRHDYTSWNLDDVCVYSGATQLLINGGFEMGSLSPWVRTPPPGGCISTPGGQVMMSSSYSGSYHLQDQCKARIDKISQQFTAAVGQMYIVSFWLQAMSIGPNILANVSLS